MAGAPVASGSIKRNVKRRWQIGGGQFGSRLGQFAGGWRILRHGLHGDRE
ncbi:MAG: hypothetical protein HC779_08475 [Phyllobacteriaceae bacterium]|nr:hypothetical protein [Phyllobacteriaceae bacterium]